MRALCLQKAKNSEGCVSCACEKQRIGEVRILFLQKAENQRGACLVQAKVDNSERACAKMNKGT